MPGKHLPQRRVITAGQARDQLVVVHHPSIAPDPGQVHDQRKKIKIDNFERTVVSPPGPTGGERGSTGNGRSGRSQGPFDSIDFELSFGRRLGETSWRAAASDWFWPMSTAPW